MIIECKARLLLLCGLGLGLAALQATVATAAEPDIGGEWVLDQKDGTKLKIADLPLTPEARAKADAADASVRSGKLIPESHILCLPDGMPHLMAAPFAIEILQTKGRVTILAEVSNLPRIIYLNGAKHPAELDPSWNGHSIGHWNRQTLVVDTIGFNDRFAILFNAGALVQRTKNLHIVEHLHLADDGHLVDEMTLDDPGVFTHPYTIGYRYRHLAADAETMESVCEVDPALVAEFAADHSR